MAEDTVPDLFKCPVCLDILLSPYTSVCGHTCCQKCWLRLTGDQQKMDLIIGRIQSVTMTCPVCRQMTFAGPNHRLRDYILENYGKQATNVTYDLVVDQLVKEIREEIQKEEAQKAFPRMQEMQQELNNVVEMTERQRPSHLYVPTLINTRAQPSRMTIHRFKELFKRWFWKLVGFNGVVAVLIAPILLSIWTYNAIKGQ